MLLYIYNTSHYPIWPYSEYKSAVAWGFQNFPYAFYTVVFALLLIHLYRLINYKFFEKTVMLIARSSFHIFLAQIFVFLIEKFYKINMNISYAFLTLFVSLLAGVVWYKLEDMSLQWGSKNVD